MKSGNVNIKEILGSHQNRMKPQTFLHPGIRIFAEMERRGVPFTNIKNYGCTVFRPGIFKRIFIDEPTKGLPYISATNVQVEQPLSSSKILSKKFTDNIDEMILHNGMILMSCAGTVGNCTLINNILENTVGSQDIIRIVDINRYGFIYAYLSTKYVYDYIQSKTYGSVVPRLEPVVVENLHLPLFGEEFQEKIDRMIKESARLREEAADALKKAQNRATGFISFVKPSENKGINIRSIASSHNKRMEASYYVSDNRNIYDIIIERPYKLLEEITEKIFRPGIFKRKYVENGITFLGGADVLLSIPNSDKKLSEKQVNQMPVLRVKKDWLLLTCGGTIGKVVYIDEQLSKCVISQHVMRIVPKDNAEVLFAFLSSSVGEKLINMFTYGSVIPSVENHHLELLPIPIYSEEETKEIKSQVREYVSKTEKAKTLELEAISLVESEIEKWTKE